eukprot:TRINITY_DN20860_c0_g1_i4.p1 TRINITY_DN20860_c0_g1~~TRINITY_DN20860_c0_g1_i4.p1  ORF type:complete len:534 (+),score=68.30 TRINITY_DN20860_c0_g1_i4:121-1602(+)
MPGKQRPRLVVPTDQWPTLQGAIAGNPRGACIQLLSGFHEEVNSLILDQPFEIDDPADQSATLVVQSGIVCAVPPSVTDCVLALRGLQLRSASSSAVTVAGPCHIEFCQIKDSAIGMLIMVNAGAEVRITHCAVTGCDVGVHFMGHPSAALQSCELKNNKKAVVIVGLELMEGCSHGLHCLDGLFFSESIEADLQLDALSVKSAPSGVLQTADAASVLLVKRFGFPCSLAAKATSCMMAVRVDRTRTFAFLSEPFEFSVLGVLPRRGRWCTEPLPAAGSKGFRERRRDFARLVAPDGPGSFLVLSAAGGGPPVQWQRRSSSTSSTSTSSRTDLDATDVTTTAGDLAASDLQEWLAGAFASSPLPMHRGLVDRCIALLSAGEGVSFAVTFDLTPVLMQPHFVLLVSPRGEVRVVWFVYVTNAVRPDMQNGHCLVTLLSEDLNDKDFAGHHHGAWLRFSACFTDEPCMAQIVARSTGQLCRSVHEGVWDLVLAVE